MGRKLNLGFLEMAFAVFISVKVENTSFEIPHRAAQTHYHKR
jgi:hypothetical protein